MARFAVVSGRSIGPVVLGMSRDEAARALAGAGLGTTEVRRWPDAPLVLATTGMDVQVYFDGDDRVEAIEVAGAGHDAQLRGDPPPHAAELDGVDLLQVPATDVEARLGEPDTTEPDHGPSLSYPRLGLRLWRDGSPDGPEDWSRAFESVLVCAPAAQAVS